MSNPINNAILLFLANDFKMDPKDLSGDLSLSQDLNLSPTQIQDLLQRLQDSLNIIFPEEQVGSVDTISDLLALTEEEDIEE